MEISRGIEKEPFFVVLYGTDGIGKTTFAADAPAPIIIGTEAGSKHINTTRAKNITTYAETMKAIKWLLKEKHEFQTVVIDSLDWLEPLIWTDLCEQDGVDSIDKYDGGYGKGYTKALDVWRKMISELRTIRAARQMNIICIAHAQVKTVNDPTQPVPYDRYMMKLNDKASALWREASDAVLFATFDDVVFKANVKDKKGKAQGGGARKIYTTRRAAWDAKNRLGLPDELPLSFQAFSDAANAGAPDSKDQILKDIKDLGALLDTEMQKKMDVAVEKAQGDIGKLLNIRNHARTLTGEK